MTPLLKIVISIRIQAVAIYVLTLLWWLSLFRGAFFFGFIDVNLLWVEAFYSLPFIMIFLAAILLRSYRRAGNPYKWYVLFAFFCSASPWIGFLFGAGLFGPP